MWSPIKHSLLVRRLGKNPNSQSSAFLSTKDEEQAGRSVGRNIQEIHLWQSESDWTRHAGMVVAVCPLAVPSWHDLLPGLPAAHCLFPLGFWHRFILCSNIRNIKRKITAQKFRLKPEKLCLLQGALPATAIRVGCPMALFPSRLPDPLGCTLSSWGLRHPVGWVLKPAHADTGWVPGLP